MADPLQTAAPAAGIKGEVRVHELQRWERAVVRRSAESRATVPDVELEVETRVDAALALAARAGVDTTTLLVRACALALREHPRANGAYRDGHLERYARVNLGLVLATETAYTIPTVFDADRRPLAELAAELAQLRERASSGELSPPELSGATFTLWDAGPLGLTRASVPVVPPQAAALVAGATRAVARLHDGGIVPEQVMTLTLACDHRIMYGTLAASFLGGVKTRLEEASL